MTPTFEQLAQSAAGRKTAWTILAESCERATSGQSINRDASFYEREIRQLGRVVAWCEARVTEQRSLQPNGEIQLRISSSIEEANALIDGELGAAGCRWGYRPVGDELADLRAHHLERERLLTDGDTEAIEAYCRRYSRRLLTLDREGRFHAADPWTPDDLLSQAVSLSDEPRLLSFVLEKNVSQHALRFAAGEAIKTDRMALFTLLLDRLQDPDAEFMGDSLLALAARMRRPAAVRTLLDRKAKPNVVWDAFLVQPRFELLGADGNGPMVNAVRNGDAEIVKLLLTEGGDPLAKTDTKRRVIDMARELGDAAIVALLAAVAGPADQQIDMNTAIATSNVARVLELLPTEGSANTIQEAAQKGNAAILGPVLSSGVAHDSGVLAKALWFSATNGHLATTRLLLGHEADPNGFVQYKKTARAMAQDNRHTEIAELLKKAGGKLRVSK